MFKPFQFTLVVALALLPTCSAIAQAETISGNARVQGPDILIIDEMRIILWGVDAPEPGQTCSLNGREWGCDEASKRTLETLAMSGEVSCELVAEPDPFGRRYGVCESGGVNINVDMIAKGMALADVSQTDDYADDEAKAKADGTGLWNAAVEFIAPWEYRQATTNTPEGQR